eukprot:98990_1
MTQSVRNNTRTNEMVKGNEILNLSFGQCGVHMLDAFYSIIMKEHKITKEGTFTGDLKNINDALLLDKWNVFFEETKSPKYIPRAMFIDLDPTSIATVQSSHWGGLLDADHFIASNVGPASNFALAHYTDGAEMIDTIMNRIRREIEICDYYQGSNIMHSLCGGTGGGLGTLAILKLRDNYPDKEIFSYSVYPTITNALRSNFQPQHFSHHNHNLAIYNASLSFHQLLENVDIHYVIDNGKLLDICRKQCKLSNPTFDDINWALSLVLSGVTSTLRFHGEPSILTNLRKTRTHYAIFPRLKNLQLCYSPFVSRRMQQKKNNVMDIIRAAWTYDNDVSTVRMEDGKIICCASIYRSNDTKAIDRMNHFESVQWTRICDDCERWIPDNLQSCYMDDGNDQFYNKYTPLTTTTVSNTTSSKPVYQRICAQFARSFKRKAYLHCYITEGMDQMEFVEADKNMRDLITEYQDKQGYDFYDEDDDESYGSEEEESDF